MRTYIHLGLALLLTFSATACGTSDSVTAPSCSETASDSGSQPSGDASISDASDSASGDTGSQTTGDAGASDASDGSMDSAVADTGSQPPVDSGTPDSSDAGGDASTSAKVLWTGLINRQSEGGFAINDTHVFFSAGGNIYAIKKDGSGLSTVVQKKARYLATTGTTLFWGGDTIGSVNTDGTGAKDVLTGTSQLSGFAADANRIYWSDNFKAASGIHSVALDGSNQQDMGTGNVNGLTLDNDFVFWATSTSIGRAKLDGTGATSFTLDLGGTVTTSIATSGSRVFVSAAQLGEILYVAKDFSTSGAYVPVSTAKIISDDKTLYFQPSGGSMFAVDVNTNAVREVLANPSHNVALSLALDTESLYILWGSTATVSTTVDILKLPR